MIKGTVTQNGLTLELECSDPSEFVSVVRGAFNREEIKKTARTSQYKVYARKIKNPHWAWSDKDIVSAARIVVENRENPYNVAKKVSGYLSAY